METYRIQRPPLVRGFAVRFAVRVSNCPHAEGKGLVTSIHFATGRQQNVRQGAIHFLRRIAKQAKGKVKTSYIGRGFLSDLFFFASAASIFLSYARIWSD